MSPDINEPGPRLAGGRDSEIFEYGPGLVLRRARDGRSLEDEAAVMRWVADHGYPVPRVHEANGPVIVMDRLEGPTMIDHILKAPWRMRAQAQLLADLHRRLAAVPAPEWLRRPSAFTGERDGVLHLDLHPLNVMITRAGPVVIDWANARRGDPAAEVASTWLIVATSVPDTALERLAVAVAKRTFLRVVLNDVGRDAARRWLRAMGEHRKADRNTKPMEKERIDRLVEQEAVP